MQRQSQQPEAEQEQIIWMWTLKFSRTLPAIKSHAGFYGLDARQTPGRPHNVFRKSLIGLKISFTPCNSLKKLMPRFLAPKLFLSFPLPSTKKSHPPQFLHNHTYFLYCRTQQTRREWVQRNVRVPDSAG
jgi:hypothetical protein